MAGPAQRTSHRLARVAVAACLVLALGPGGAACGGPARPERYDDDAHAISLVYDAGQFAPGTLVQSGLMGAAERAAGAEPVAAVEFTARAPGAQATGVRIAVFEGPANIGELGFWRVTGQLLDGALREARAAVAPAVTIGDAERVTVAGLEGYAASFRLDDPLEPGAGLGLALWRAPYVYEVIVLCRTTDRRLMDELTRMLVDLRLGRGLQVAAP
jgi:hypothetical protein